MTEQYEPYNDEVDDSITIPEADDPTYDELVNAELLLPHRDKQSHAVVVGRSKSDDGTLYGRYDKNPAVNTAVYDVLFDDGTIKKYAANIIAENLWSQVDDEGSTYLMLDEITDHRKMENAVEKGDEYITTKRGNRKLRKTTIGWEICVLWKDGSQQWISLKDLKESNPIEVADYVAAMKLTGEPAFKW